MDDPTTLARASQVSKKWHELVNDDSAWRLLYQKFSYRTLSNEERNEDDLTNHGEVDTKLCHRSSLGRLQRPEDDWAGQQNLASSANTLDSLRTRSLDRGAKQRSEARRTKATTYRFHFKQRYMVETAWRSGGICDARQITPEQGVVTSLHLTKKYIVVALDNAKIHVFDVNGSHQKTLSGHAMGVWATVPWGDFLVSGGCDRDVRVWSLATGYV